MPDRNPITVDLRKIADPRLIEMVGSSNQRGLALDSGSHDPLDEAFGAFVSAEDRDGDGALRRAVGKLKSARRFVQRLRGQVFAHSACEGGQHGMGMSTLLLLRYFGGMARRARGRSEGAPLRECRAQQYPAREHVPHRKLSGKRHYTFGYAFVSSTRIGAGCFW